MSWDSFSCSGDAFMVNSHAYLNINQALVNWIILIHHFAKSHRVPDNFSPVQVDGFDRPFSSRTLLKVEIDDDFSHSQNFA